MYKLDHQTTTTQIDLPEVAPAAYAQLLQQGQHPSKRSSNMAEDGNIPATGLKRVVIVGAGFAGLEAAKQLEGGPFQVVLLDKNNYNQFQPLFYQVATAGLEPSSISFPLRKLFQNRPNVHIRVTAVEAVNTETKKIQTSIGEISYDYLILALGADTNFFGNERIKSKAIPMKSVAEALYLRNRLLENYEKALLTTDPEERQALMNVVVVGGGPTGVEVSGALAEMREHVLPKDLPELNFNHMEVTLVEASPSLLNGMKPTSGKTAEKYLGKMGVTVMTSTAVEDYDGQWVTLSNGKRLLSQTLIWAAGIKANQINGIPAEVYTRGGRLLVDQFAQVKGLEDVFAVGDMALMQNDAYPNGHPQVAQVAMQMATTVAQNLNRSQKGGSWRPFTYNNLGSMATIGRNKAVADFPNFSVKGLFAWLIWMFIHLMSLVGARNKVVVFVNWLVSYFSYDQSLRLIIKPKTD